MKRKLLLFSIALLLCLMTATSWAAPFAGGSGTPGEPWIIATPAQLDAVRDYPSAHFKLNNDIDLTAYLVKGGAGYAKWVNQGWEPIGDWLDMDRQFSGGFDGDGRKITGLWINRPSSNNVGLFGVTSNDTIKNLGVEIADAGVIFRGRSGGLVGEKYGGSIENCYVTGNISGTGAYIGGLVGDIDGGSIRNSHVTGNIGGTGSNKGGLVGRASGASIENCYATGNVSGNMSNMGGLVGLSNPGSSIENSHATGNVIGDYGVGGLVGGGGGRIKNSHATGNIRGNNGGGFGGLVGSLSSTGIIENSYAAGDVIGDYCIGGLVGMSSSGGIIKNSYATGNVDYVTGSANAGGAVGGLVGSHSSSGSIENCYATSNVRGTKGVGGLVGSNSFGASINNCYAAGNVSGNTYLGALAGNNDSGTIANCYRYESLTVNGAVVPTSDTDSVSNRKHGDTVSQTQLTTQETYSTTTSWQYTPAGPWHWDSRGFPKLNPGTENWPWPW